MKGDFSRDTFDADKHYLRVLIQQGRVPLDSDWNEQGSILLHRVQSLARDLIGPHGCCGSGFEVKGIQTNDFAINKGRCYIRGVLCENSRKTQFSDLSDVRPESRKNYLVYLHAWERHVTYIEDDSIREQALLGVDTAIRSQLVWQVCLKEVELDGKEAKESFTNRRGTYQRFLEEVEKQSTAELAADLRVSIQSPDEGSSTLPERRYLGVENQLYRVEIHQGGEAGTATWKWSRDNGSVAFPIATIASDSASGQTTVTLEHLGRDRRFAIKVGDWVEVVDDPYVLRFNSRDLLQVEEVRENDRQAVLAGTPTTVLLNRHPLMRRWDQKATDRIQLVGGVIGVEENKSVELEAGIQITFVSADRPEKANYRTGDYWLIPARVATGSIEWPNKEGRPTPLPPRGINHYYAPLAHIVVSSDGVVTPTDLRHKIVPSNQSGTDE